MERNGVFIDENTHITPLKRKNGEDEVEFKKGTLKRIVAQDFMTYNHAVVHCTPKLNVIVGPNGTGKSSIVCALCLALGGRNELLARQAQTRSFVRRGAAKGYAEVTISGGSGRDYTVRRSISADNDTSTWTINGSSSTMESVKKLMKKLNVQLDNLLQFMPQDRVSEFSNLSPTNLLLETERAIGDADLYDKHKKLIELSHSTTTARKARDSVHERLAQVESELEDMEMDVQRVLRRDELLKEVEVIKAKLVWAEAWDKKARFEEANQKLLEGKDKVARSEKLLKQHSVPSRGLQAEIGQLHRTVNTAQEHLQKLQASLEENESFLSGFDGNMTSRDNEIEAVATESRKYREEIEMLQSQISDLEQELANCPTVPQELLQRRQQLQKEKIDIGSKVRSEKQKLDAAVAECEKKTRVKEQCEEYLRRIEKETSQRVLAVERRREKFRGLHAAYEWVQSNKSIFSDEVFGPIIAEVEANDPFHATALEQVVSFATWSCFVTKNANDTKLLRKVLPERGIMKEVNVMTIESSPSEQLRNADMPGSLPDFGISSTLDQVINAPQLVKHALNIHHEIAHLYIGSMETESKAQELFAAHPEIRKLITPESIYMISKSRYSNAKAIQSSCLRPLQLYRLRGRSSEYTIEKTRIDTLEKDIQTLTKDIKQQEAYIEGYQQQIEEIDHADKELLKEVYIIKQRKTRLQKDIASGKRTLGFKTKVRDPIHKREALIKEKNDTKDEAVCKVKETRVLLKEMFKYHQTYAAARLAAAERGLLITMNSSLVTKMKETLDRRKVAVSQLQQIVDQDRRQFENAQQRAQSLFPMTNSLRRKFNKYPGRHSTEDLEVLSHEKDCEAAGINCNNSEALEDYRSRKKHASTLQNALMQEDQKLSNLETQARDVKGSWLPELKETIEKINNTFTKNFRLIGSVGEVELVGEREHDTKYENYSLEIRVKFRESEPLRALDSSTQSGGERSVSTMLYLISLQSVTYTPFRVVDEINQGMDAVNERKIFNILVSSSRSPTTPQCFLLTPKLLPDMEYPEGEDATVTIQSIFNGPRVPPSNHPEDWGTFAGSRLKRRKIEM